MATEKEFLKRYNIKKKLGQGGMAKVYLAHDKLLDRYVALKTIHAPESLEQIGSDAQQVLQRIHREARAIAKLNHPNILTIHDIQLPDEENLNEKNAHSIYLALEYVQGHSVENICRSREDSRFTEIEAYDIAIPIADALSCAHSRGVVHRDIKPANVMIEAQTGRIVLLDFSLSYMFGHTQQTLTQQPIGTPEFMSPEQILSPKNVDYRTDIYSLGLVLYFMLNGKPPFQADSYFKLCEKQVKEAPTPLHEIRSDVTGLTSDIISTALRKNPDERIQSATQFHQLLISAREIVVNLKKRNISPSQDEINILFNQALKKDVFMGPELEPPVEPSPTVCLPEDIQISSSDISYPPDVEKTEIPQEETSSGGDDSEKKKRRPVILLLAAALFLVAVALFLSHTQNYQIPHVSDKINQWEEALLDMIWPVPEPAPHPTPTPRSQKTLGSFPTPTPTLLPPTPTTVATPAPSPTPRKEKGMILVEDQQSTETVNSTPGTTTTLTADTQTTKTQLVQNSKEKKVPPSPEHTPVNKYADYEKTKGLLFKKIAGECCVEFKKEENGLLILHSEKLNAVRWLVFGGCEEDEVLERFSDDNICGRKPRIVFTPEKNQKKFRVFCATEKVPRYLTSRASVEINTSPLKKVKKMLEQYNEHYSYYEVILK